MKSNQTKTHQLEKDFSSRKSFRWADLRDFYQDQLDDFDGNMLRRILYSLERDGKIIRVDKGRYIFGKNRNLFLGLMDKRKRFAPVFSAELQAINDLLGEKFRYARYCIWETSVLYEFMIHQPARNLTILDVEKDAVEAVFDFLAEQFPGKVFLKPDSEMMENYVFRLLDAVIVVPMISRSPVQMINNIPAPKLEKILVDLIADEDRFYIFHGQELVNIYENAFQNYQISERTLFSYAGRRNVVEDIRELIDRKTRVQLIQEKGVIE